MKSLFGKGDVHAGGDGAPHLRLDDGPAIAQKMLEVPMLLATQKAQASTMCRLRSVRTQGIAARSGCCVQFVDAHDSPQTLINPASAALTSIKPDTTVRVDMAMYLNVVDPLRVQHDNCKEN